MEDDAFEGLNSLRVLLLHSNNLTVAPSLQHIRHITYLRLNNNRNANLPRAYFTGCVYLTGLNLASNYLVSLPDMTPVSQSLRVLSLSANRLMYLDALGNKKWPNLRTLTLGRNSIMDLNINSIENKKSLEFISLFRNELHTLPDLRQLRMFQNTSHILTIRVEGNPWNCDESLRWVLEGTRDWDYLNFDEGLRLQDPTHMPCHTPAKLNDTPLWDLGEFIMTPIWFR